jgi:hypothetical protein
MSVPWQCDAASCRSGYDFQYDPYLPTFWAARVPNHVLSTEDYATVIDTTRPYEKRLEAFNNREFWLRWLTGAGLQQITDMVNIFGQLGVIEKKPGPADKTFPVEMFVESKPQFAAVPLSGRVTLDDWHNDRARRYNSMVKTLG